MRLVYEAYFSVFGSAGVSVLALSATFSVLMMFFRRKAEGYEHRVSEKMKAAGAEVSALKGELKGEALFLATEKIYEKHDYHPIQSVGMGASFLVMLPILLSALFLFSDDRVVNGQAFLFVADLSKPDGLLGPINLLPFLMSGITIVDARMRFADDRSAQVRFYVIAAVLLVLVHGLASALVLYWTMSNLFALILAKLRKRGETEPTAGV